MPTVPSEPHDLRAAAESFGADPERYDRSRPRYPAAMVDAIIAVSPGRDVLDVGVGTGIAARQFQAAGCRVLGVDPDARMAEFARRGGIDVEVAAFETWQTTRVFDLVVSGQAWHWVDPVAGAAKAAEVLRPGGQIALFWNVFQLPPDLVDACAEVHRRVMPGPLAEMATRPALDGYSMLCDRAADGLRGAFDEPERWRFEWTCEYTKDEWLDVLPTQGGYSQLPPARLAELLAGLGDAVGDGFTAEYTTVLVTAERRAG
ncbi:class I SAM-dependent methyltransferase [Lentzea tibetensis]|uniref:Class I SAM-dependent methyltransferase n=1 Tax=Lentzea tibetensis TaxID=2591470 RepID=A0A563EM70_9PSEU|nr:class I SAM-dependent methyltransferase [Lentzea tibetensis]TWP48011.1 class I SAM-dependent methyltransferase [Lentzea tibetensis]